MLVSSRKTNRTHISGLTLVELLVVLSILAVLSTVALRSVVGNFEQTNYDANVSQLEQIELAILGGDDFSGFVGDIGRLPIARGSDATTQLAELWDQNVATAAGISRFAVNSAPGDNEVRLGTGWRGPYLNLGLNRDDLTDSFANAFLLYESDGSQVANTETVSIIQSFGANGTTQTAPDDSETSYEEDFEVIFEADAVLANIADVAQNHWQSDLTVSVIADPAPIERENSGIAESVVVRIYGADASGDLVTLEQVEISIPSTGTPNVTVVLDGDDDAAVDTGAGLPLGQKVIRAYRVEDADIPLKQADILADDKSLSPATHLILDRFNSTLTLTLYASP